MSEQKPKAKTKAQLMAEKMAAKRVGEAAFEAGKKPVVESTEPPVEETPVENVPEEKKEEIPAVATEPAQNEAQAEAKGKDPSKKKKPGKAVSEPSEGNKEKAPIFNFDDITAAIRPEKKTYTLYLSNSVMEEIEKRAKKAGLKPSPYLDELLKRVFGL